MLLSLVAAALVAPVLSGPVLPDTITAAESPAPGQVAWFEGTFEEALALAASQDRLVFVDFWTDWCVWCKRLDADVFSQESVATALDDLVCLSVDAESKTGAPVAKRFNVLAFPTLLVLNSDGSVRDTIAGYMPPAEFIAEIERIQADEGTLSALRRRVEEEPASIEARFDLANKLESLGDSAGYDEQVAAIRELDPEQKSQPMRELLYASIIKQLDAQALAAQYADIERLLAFLEEETHEDLLFEGYYFAWRIEEFHSRLAGIDNSGPEAVEQHRVAQLAMARKAWEHVPEELVGPIGNNMAWAAWEARDVMSDDYKAFALEVAVLAQATDENDTSLLDTLGCVRFMNGDREGALECVERCLELEPEKELWQTRFEEFQPEQTEG